MLKYANKLLRFRDPFINKLKIYKEVILKNCLIPRYTSNSIKHLNLHALETIFTLIFNASLNELNSSSKITDENTILNTYLAYENTRFFSSQRLIEEIINCENFFVNQIPGITLDKISKINNLQLREINELFSSAGYENNVIAFTGLTDYENR